MKRTPAFFAALIITVLIGAAMFTIGGNALANKDTVPLSNSPNSTPASTTAGDPPATSDQARIQQLQGLVTQYQSREQQYQSQLNQLEQQLSQDNAEIQQFQSLLVALQNSGLIRIGQDGRIFIRGGF